MADISKIKVAEATYDIKDNSAREQSTQINSNKNNIIQLQQDVENIQNEIDNMPFPVKSVNTKTGEVTLTASDIGAAPIAHIDKEASVDEIGHVKISNGTINIDEIPTIGKDTAASLYDVQQMGKSLNDKIAAAGDNAGCIKKVNGKTANPDDPNGAVIITSEDINISMSDTTKINDKIVELQQEIEDNKVEANPEEETTLTLNTIKIGNDIYEIAGTSPSGGQTIQVDSFPPAAADYLDTIYQYVGESIDNYINGYFYKCVYEEETYLWKQIPVQSGGGEGGTSDYNDLSNRPSINGVTLVGNKTSSNLGVAAEQHTHTTSDITDLDLSTKVDIAQGSTNKDKILKVNDEGNLELSVLPGSVQVVSSESEIKEDSILIIDTSEDYGAGGSISGGGASLSKPKLYSYDIDTSKQSHFSGTINIVSDMHTATLYLKLTTQVEITASATNFLIDSIPEELTPFFPPEGILFRADTSATWARLLINDENNLILIPLSNLPKINSYRGYLQWFVKPKEA